MALVTIVANGQDNYASFLSFLGGSPLDTRIATYLAQYDGVLNVSVDDKSRVFSIWGGTYPFQVTIRLDTRNNAADVPAITERVKLAIYQATGYLPSAVAITSAGQTAPTAPANGLGDNIEEIPTALVDLINKTAHGLGTTVETAKWLLVAVGIGGIVLVYFVASNPGRAARIVRG